MLHLSKNFQVLYSMALVKSFHGLDIVGAVGECCIWFSFLGTMFYV